MSHGINDFHRKFEAFYTECRSIGQTSKWPSVVIDGYALWIALLRDYSIAVDSRLFSLGLRFLSRNSWLDILRCLSISDELLLSETEDNSYRSFKRIWSSHLADIELLCQLRCYFNAQDEVSFKALHQCFSFMKKLTIDRPELKDEAIDSFLQREKNQSQVDGSDLQPILKLWLTGFTMDDFYPRHGNGSCADSSKWIVDKYSTFEGADQELSYFIRHYHLNGWYPEGLHPQLDTYNHRTSKVVCVPKTWKSVRTICEEPAILQYHQQGVLSAMATHFRRSSYLRRRINLADQTRNQELAELGSLGGMFCTIDLSAASDSVSLDLVRTAFYRTPLLAPLLCTRSYNCDYKRGENPIELKKFAAMGSAVTFPVECLVFAAICEFSILETGDDPRRSDYSVYGDDIVIETEYYDSVVRNLQRFGFTINSDKSFNGSSSYGFFRESCGGEYLNMVDVTPMRLSRRFTGLKLQWSDASGFEAMVDMVNNTAVYHYRSLRLVLLWFLRKFAGRHLYYDDGTYGIFSTQPTNWANQEKTFEPDSLTDPRWYAGIQRPVSKVVCPKTKHEESQVANAILRSPLVEQIRLFETLKARSDSGGAGNVMWQYATASTPEGVSVSPPTKPGLELSWKVV